MPRGLLLAAVVSASWWGAPALAVSDVIPGLPDQIPGHELPLIQEHRYTMRGRVRPLLAFWISRDDVGSASIRWRGDETAAAYELMIGSDPGRSPRQLNRWGYLAEEVRGDHSLVLGLMSKSDEQSLDEVETGLTQTSLTRPLETIRGHVTAHAAYSLVSPMQPSGDWTYRDVNTAIDLLFAGSARGPVQEVARPGGTRPGFLTSVDELVQRSVQAHKRGQSPSPGSLSYVYGRRLYVMQMRPVVFLPQFELDGRTYQRVLRARFEARRQDSRRVSQFELIYGTSGPLSGVPILISYQPKWWLQVELHLQG
jgi:hypothetical protein